MSNMITGLSGTVTASASLSGSIIETFLKGLSAYEIAVKKGGYIGTEEEWLASLKGDQVVLRNNQKMIQWKYAQEDDTEWRDLIDFSELDYNDLINKPLVNGQELAGNVDLSDTYVTKEDFALITDEDIEDILDRLKGGNE